MDNDDYVVRCYVPGKKMREWRYRTVSQAVKQRDGIAKMFRLEGQAVTITLRAPGEQPTVTVVEASEPTAVKPTGQRPVKKTTPPHVRPPRVWSVKAVCGILLAAAVVISVFIGSLTDDEPVGSNDKRACQEKYKNAGDGTVDWTAICNFQD
ncbi:hypothetical protein [Streptomyces paludis]|uniref:Uncharacterized protein n=1 Tax=Streptomyces paludis TaxID=2282738 RepID=A0A345HQT9_9ACTN|nr:hypothetical protein [Streptomyces paludis]AXG79063.1 hypothetical protein DVK44_16750 [Streptomyces paludis]